MDVRAVICRKATVMLPDAISLLPEHKIVVFVLVCGKRGIWKAQFCHKNHLEGAVSA